MTIEEKEISTQVLSKDKDIEEKISGLTDNIANSKLSEKPLESNEKDEVIDEDLDFDFAALKKKKKKKKLKVGEAEGAPSIQAPTIEIERPVAVAENIPTYTYEFLLTRIFDKLKEKNPGLLDTSKKKFASKPPVLARVGTKKTAFINFVELCKNFKRKPSHVLTFILAELGTTGSVDANNQLIVKGRYETKQMENILRKYLREFVICHTCRSTETELIKETRLFFLQCNTCGSRCSVSSIKTGFQALTSKRAQQKAK